MPSSSGSKENTPPTKFMRPFWRTDRGPASLEPRRQAVLPHVRWFDDVVVDGDDLGDVAGVLVRLGHGATVPENWNVF